MATAYLDCTDHPKGGHSCSSLESLRLRSHTASFRLHSSQGTESRFDLLYPPETLFLCLFHIIPFLNSFSSFLYLSLLWLLPITCFLCSRRPLAWRSGISAVTHVYHLIHKASCEPQWSCHTDLLATIVFSPFSFFSTLFSLPCYLMCWISSHELPLLCLQMALFLSGKWSVRVFSRWFLLCLSLLDTEMGQVYECRNIKGIVKNAVLALGWRQEGYKFETCLVYMGRTTERV